MRNTSDHLGSRPAARLLGSNRLNRLNRLPLKVHALVAAGSFVGLGAVNGILNQSYADSRFPVPYAEGQTTFSGSRVKEFYQFMIEQGTLDIYWRTQFIDFGFILAMVALGLTVGSLLARLNRPGSAGAKAGMAVTWLLPLGAAFDAIENLISFVMLAQPESFPDWLAVPYSTAAVIKFGFITIGMMAIIASLVFLAGTAVARRFRSGHRADNASHPVTCYGV
jgi:hypothetical protein